MKKIVMLFICFGILSNANSQPGKNGPFTVTTPSTIVNSYCPLSSNLSAGSNTLSLALPGFMSLCVGDLIMVYQAQGASIDFTNTLNYGAINSYNSAGLYEIKYVQSINANIITTQTTFTNSYAITGRPQIIKIPQYTTLTINPGAGIIANPWKDTTIASVNYRIGGLIVIHATTIVNNGIITANGSGFRGGVNVNNTTFVNGITSYVSTSINHGAEKGEGIFGYRADYDPNGGRYCRGAAANGGGGSNTTNASGGGGANGFNGNAWTGQGVMVVNATNPIAGWVLDPGYIANSNALTNSSGGGRGGYSWSLLNGNAYINGPGSAVWSGDSRREVGGMGGKPLTNIDPERRIYFGGGGGGGHMNDFAGNSGSNGGGIIYLMSSSITGSGNITSNGLNVPNTTGWNGDGNGGAGAGGSIILKSASISGLLNVVANGGQGGSQMVVTGAIDESEGPGGGGGGGFIASFVLITASVNGGPNGTTLTPSISEMPSNGGTAGATGQILTFSSTPLPFIPLTVISNTPCAGSTLTFTCSPGGNYNWHGPNGFSSTLQNPTIVNTTTAMSGTYSVDIGSGGNCTSLLSLTLAVTINPSPLLTVTDATICAGETATLSATGATSYTWSTGVVTGNTFTDNPVITTVYTVTGQSAGTCTSSSVGTINISSPLAIAVTNGTICGGNSFTINPTGASSYTYSGGTSVVTPTASSNYTITGSDITGFCTGSVLCTVIISPTPTLTVNSGSICVGSSFTLLPTGFNSYTYSGGSAIVSPTTTTSYSVVGTNTLGCVVTNTVVSTVTVVAQPILSVNSGSICESSSFTIVPTGGLSYTFSAGSNTVSPLSTTNYTVTGSNIAGCTSSVIATVTVIPKPVFTLGSNSSTLCLGASAIINALGASNYLWNTGQTTNSISVTPIITTVYTVTATNSIGGLFCSSTQTISVKVIPQTTVSLYGGGDICLGTSTIIYALGASNYSWSSFPNKPTPKTFSISVNPTVTTIYTVTALSSLSCPATGTIQVTVNPLPYVYAGIDTTINIDEYYTLNGLGNVDVGFLSPAGYPLICNFCASVIVNPKESTCFILKGENEYHCAAYDEICITVTKDWDIYIPNTFTPNGDNLNDFFIPVGYGITAINLIVFDKWGTEIFKSTNDIVGWDGKYKGSLCEQGVYVYKVEINTMEGTTFYRAGHINLLPKNK